jgi:hypothetical protein
MMGGAGVGRYCLSAVTHEASALSGLPLLPDSRVAYPSAMPEIMDVILAPSSNPFTDELAGFETPCRPFSEGNGWYAHYFYQTGAAPASRRLTVVDHAELWCRLI